jgi:uncharacterized membrane protein YecN with MAPEG domain
MLGIILITASLIAVSGLAHAWALAAQAFAGWRDQRFRAEEARRYEGRMSAGDLVGVMAVMTLVLLASGAVYVVGRLYEATALVMSSTLRLRAPKAPGPSGAI